MTGVILRVYGRPKPEGSKTAYSARLGLPPVVVEDDPGYRKASWRATVVEAAAAEIRAGFVPFGRDVAVRLHVEFLFERPSSHPKRRPPLAVSNATGDLDKLCRAVMDALTAAGLWHDDRQVVGLRATKLYAEADERPGAVIAVELAAPTAQSLLTTTGATR